MTEPFLSLVVPAYNEEGRLPATLARVSDYLSSRGHPYEIIVVVNGSTDRTADVAEAAARTDSNVRVIQTARRGKGHAVRLGVLGAVGVRVLFCDAVLSSQLEEVVGLCERLVDRLLVVF